MASRIFKRFRDLLDVDFGTPSDGDVATYDAGSDSLVMAAPTGGGGGGTAAGTTLTPAGNISSTNVQAGIEELDSEKQPLNSDLTAIAALSTTAFGRGLLILADAAALLSAAGAAASSHVHSGSDITSGTVADARIDAAIARDTEVTAAIAALSGVYQPLDSDLTAIAALTTTTFGRSLLTQADAAAVRALLDLEPGTDFASLSTFNDHSARHEDGGADEISLTGLSGTPADLATHLADSSDAHDASAISIADAGSLFTATDVEGALTELAGAFGGGAVSPDDITNLVMWLIADDLDAALADGDPISTWADASGNGNDATQSSTARPTFKTSIVQGHDVVRFDGSDDGFETGLTLAHPFSIFYVAKYEASNSNNRIIQGDVNNWLLGCFGGAWQWYSGGFAATLGAPGSFFVIHGCTQNASSGSHFFQTVDSADVFPVGNAVSFASRGAPGVIGKVAFGRSGANNEGLGFDLAEVAIYTRELTGDEGNGLLAYFRDKYGA